MLLDFDNTEFPARGNVLRFDAARPRPEPIPFPPRPYTRTPSPEAALERRLMQYRVEGERSARMKREAYDEGHATGLKQGWHDAAPLYFLMGAIVGLAL
jgi:hypothetical protein